MLNRALETFDLSDLRDWYYRHLLSLIVTSSLFFYVGFNYSILAELVPNQIAENVLALPQSDKISAEVNRNTILQAVLNTIVNYPTSGHLQDFKVLYTASSVIVHFGTASIFKAGDDIYNHSRREEIVDFVSQLKSYQSDLHVRVEAYTDNSPIVKNAHKFPNNQLLSEARAQKIAEVFLDQGYEQNQVQTEGYGESFPAFENRDNNGHRIHKNQRANRRVMLVLTRR